ncbi:MAG: hypothetical protein II612_01310 [Prevotella sp.]|nr:hypothetical protein [Prevotella sp.]
MANNSRLWSDEYWLLLMQLYLKKPEGLKPIYSRPMVELGLELHIEPAFLYEQMFKLRQLETPRMEKLWERYGNNPKRLAKGVKLLRAMKGMGNAEQFYEGVETQEQLWEQDFKPLEEEPSLKPVMLLLTLDLYFRLTPNTMVAETPEIQELARLMRVKEAKVVEIMDIYQVCDPYLNRSEIVLSPLLRACQRMWNRFGNANPEKLAALAAQMKEYFRS